MAQLPPKVPPNVMQNWPAFHQNHHHQALFPPPLPPSNPHQGQSSWMDQFLDYSSHPRGSHRRSMSDSVTTFLDVKQKQPEKKYVHELHDFDGLNNEQLMTMFSDNVLTLGDSSSVVSDQNSDNGDCETDGRQIKSGFEMEKQKDVDMYVDNNETGEIENSQKFLSMLPGNSSSSDTITDPKRVKRILANRQSAQRSRVKKLHYISELEQSVTLLQTEVSALSPRVAYLDHQRLILNMENSALKQKIAALTQDNIFKDAHEDALKKEIERLREVYHHQQKRSENGSSNKEREVVESR